MGPPIYIGGNNSGFLPRFLIPKVLQWGHRFTSVETGKIEVTDQSPLVASMGPPIYIGGNSAPLVRIVQMVVASMGPPIYIGGNGFQIFCRGAYGLCFNGATDLHRWKPSTGVGIVGFSAGFNGATDLHRWKLARRKKKCTEF